VPRAYPVPLEMRDENKIVGNWLSMRQLGMLGGGLVIGVFVGGLIFALTTAFGASRVVGLSVAIVPLVIASGSAAVLAFLPAGWAGILPGPEQPISPDPYDPPMRIDQWLSLWRAFRAKPKVLPFKRSGYVQHPPLYYRNGNGKGSKK